MNLPASGVEYATWTVAADTVLDGPVSIAFLPWGSKPGQSEVWYPATWQGEPATTRDIRLLLAGAAVTDPPPEAVKLQTGTWWTWVRLLDTPERIVRLASEVHVSV